MNQTTAMVVATIVVTLEVVLVLWAFGMLLRGQIRSWRDELVRECTRSMPDLQNSLAVFQQEVRLVGAKLDQLREMAEREAADLRRIQEHLAGSPKA